MLKGHIAPGTVDPEGGVANSSPALCSPSKIFSKTWRSYICQAKTLHPRWFSGGYEQTLIWDSRSFELLAWSQDWISRERRRLVSNFRISMSFLKKIHGWPSIFHAQFTFFNYFDTLLRSFGESCHMDSSLDPNTIISRSSFVWEGSRISWFCPKCKTTNKKYCFGTHRSFSASTHLSVNSQFYRRLLCQSKTLNHCHPNEDLQSTFVMCKFLTRFEELP